VIRSFGPILRVLLPGGWTERENQPPGRVFQASSERPGGSLRVTVDEPLEIGEGETLDDRLWAVLDQVAAADHGQRFHEYTGDSTLGRIVTAAYQHVQFGLVQIWVSGGPKGTVMATYTMSLEETVAQELIDAQGIVESADLDGSVVMPRRAKADPAPPHASNRQS
jgi:hypothetical protein